MLAFIVANRSQMLLLTQVDLSSIAPEGSAVREGEVQPEVPRGDRPAAGYTGPKIL